MAQPAVFVDTGALIALTHRGDALHTRAAAIEAELRQSGRRVVTSDWVLAKYLSAMARPPARQTAVTAVERLQSLQSVLIVPA